MLNLGDLSASTVQRKNLRIKFSENSRVIEQHVKEATKYKLDSKPSIIDLILTDNKGGPQTSIICHPWLSDHKVQVFGFHIVVNKDVSAQDEPNIWKTDI